MNFKNGRDLMDYIVENDLLEVPINVVFDFKKPKVEVWFGDFVFGDYMYCDNSKDSFPIAIVNSIDEKLIAIDKVRQIWNGFRVIVGDLK